MMDRFFIFDRIGIFFLITFGISGLFSILYAIPTVKQSKLRYYLNVLLLLLVALGIASTLHPLLIFVFFELLTVFCWRLVAWDADEERKKDASYMLLFNFACASLMLIGIARMYVVNGISYEVFWKGINELKIDEVSMLLLLFGIFAKSVVFPLHVWLIRAYRSVSCAGGGIFAGIAEISGGLVFYRFFLYSNVSSTFVYTVMIIAVFSSIFGGLLAYLSNNTRRLLAFSTISQMSFAVLGIASKTPEGTIGAFLVLFTSAIAKSGLFYSVGIVEDYFSSTKLSEIHGFSKISKTLSFAFALLGFGMAGVPPSVGFFGKLFILLGLFKMHIGIAIAGVLGAILTFFYIIRFYTSIFFGEQDKEKRKISGYLITIPLVLSFVLFVVGILHFIPYRFLAGGMPW